MKKSIMYKAASTLGLAVLLCISACSRQQSDWEKTRASNTTDAYEAFLKKYPKGEFTAQAEARIKSLYEERDWQKARDLDTAEAYQAFVKQYPEGKWSDEARIRIENWSLAGAPSSASSGSAAPGSAALGSATPASTEPESADAQDVSGGSAVPTPGPSVAKPARKKSANPPVTSSSTSSSESSASRGGTYGVQLGAFKSGEDAAHKRWTVLTAQFPKTLSGLSPHISPRKGAHGVMYRLRVANLTHQGARAICSELRAHSQVCAVVPPRRLQ